MAAVDQNELLSQIKVQAYTILMFTSTEPQMDLPEPKGMSDLDSFSIVQLVLALEEIYDVMLLEEISSFSGESFEELAAFIAERITSGAVAE